MAENSQESGNVPTRLVLDFDGTCTQIPPVYERYLEHYRRGLEQWKDSLGGKVMVSLGEEEWQEAQKEVRDNSPRAAWTVAGCPAAPAAADPYILADESAKLILRRRNKDLSIPFDIHKQSYETGPAPWRCEALDTFVQLIDRGIQIHIVSNSSTQFITQRLGELFANSPSLLAKVAVHGGAGKFRICELRWDNPGGMPAAARARFVSLPAAPAEPYPKETERPIYIRRGAYFEVIAKLLSGRLEDLPTTLFCGDVWELDLALPHALGACVHLIERASPFDTYDYERASARACGNRGRISHDLTGLFDWF